MKIASLLAITAALLISGCASVDMATKEESAKAKEFKQPSADKAGVYIYRNSFVGKALKKDVFVDGKCIGESAPDVFFYTEVKGGQTHKIDTESEFSPNTLEIMFETGKNYFIRQFIKLGVFVGGAGLEQVSEEQGKKDVAQLELAKQGKCSD
jgi:PBP1b-binding outer membrane lipoprotein LpoB